jgi:transposase-like protein
VHKKSECLSYALSHPEISLEQHAKDFEIGYSTPHKWIRQAQQAGQASAQRE